MKWKQRKEDEMMIKVKLQKIIFATHFSETPTLDNKMSNN